MDLSAVIDSPRHVANGAGAWTGTLAEAIRLDGDRMSQRAFDNDFAFDEDGEPRWDTYTLDQWRVLLDDPNAEVAAEQA